jgi:hypothetical protein
MIARLFLFLTTVVNGYLGKEIKLNDSASLRIGQKASLGSLAGTLLAGRAGSNRRAHLRPKPTSKRASPPWRRTFEGASGSIRKEVRQR